MTEPPRLPDDIHTIPAALAFWAVTTPAAPALLIEDGGVITHATLQRAITNVNTWLTGRGITRHSRVALLLHGGHDSAVALLGVMAVATAVPFHPAATAPELRRDLERLRPDLLIVEDATKALGAEVASTLAIPVVALDGLVAWSDDPAACGSAGTAPDQDDIAIILHTSGTTGLPKRVLRSHRSYVATARAARQSTNLTHQDVALLTAGLANNMGVANLLAALLNGGSGVVMRRFDPHRYGAWLDRYQPTWTVTTNTELTMLLDAAAGRDVAGPRSRLRVVRAGAQALAPGVAERVEGSLRALVCDGFGMTEASYVAGDGPTAADRRPGSCGRPITSTIRILDPHGADLPTGETGDVVIRGPTLFSGYLDDPEANAAAFLPGGWFRTGDVGYLDGDGYLYLTGRGNELINRGGEKIAPLEVDHALLSHPQVAAAAAFAVPDARLGEDVVAAVVLTPGSDVTARQLRAWLLDRLTPAKSPRRIWFVDDLPRTATGKVRRMQLAEQFLNQRHL